MSHRPGPYRLPSGGEIDRTRIISFRFDGSTYRGHPGDTLASALLANGVRTVARSFKFHRPRGIYSCGMEEPNALLEVGQGAHATASMRAPLVELADGLTACPQEGWPSVSFDVGRVLDFAAPLWAAGFYNKTFIWPSWRPYEGIIRHLAGLGRAPHQRDPDRYDVRNLHCDVLVVGGGASGLTAAAEAAHAGERVLLAEQTNSLGESKGDVPRPPSGAGVESTAALLASMPNVRLLIRTTAVGIYDHNVVALLERTGGEQAVRTVGPRERYWIVHAGRVILASGAIEQPLIFANNDRPGIMLAGAAHEYLRSYGVAVGSRVLIATNNDSAYALAKDLKQAGVTVVALIDTRQGLTPINTKGFSALRSVTVGRLTKDGRGVIDSQTFACDALAMSGGFAPALQLYAQGGGRLIYDEASGVLQPALTSGNEAPAIEIVGAASRKVPIGPRLSPVGNTRRQWVDLLHDVTVADLELSLRENFTNVEHVKRYTTIGMAADQGKTATAATLEVLGRLRGMSSHELGHTTLRPPVVPVTLGAIVGREIGEFFSPMRHLPMHDWHVAHGALLQDFGGWQRPIAYLRAGETREQATRREARATRTASTLLDASSLGKIEIQGPDALEFIDRFYINNLKSLQLGRTRYGFMLRESGMLFDDGTVVALAPDHLLITTTSGNAARVYQWLEEWHQCEWPSLRVAITPVTEQWATLSLAGPRARQILSQFDLDIDLSNIAFPHLAMRRGKLLGVPVRIYRVSFTGELTYEINIPADAATGLWERLMEQGSEDGLQPLGLDALTMLRLEKGFLHLGSDTDGTTIPDDVGWGKVAAAKTADYIGKRSLSLPEHLKPDRRQLVGLKADRPFIIGSHLRVAGSHDATDGWITSAGIATLTGELIALAMLRAGRSRLGEEVTVYDAGAPIAHARVMQPPFYDPAGERIHA